MFKKPCYVNHLKFLACIGRSSKPEITSQAVGARELKLNEDFTGIQRNGSKSADRRSSSIMTLLLSIFC